jgi:RNA polymerase sigma-70 factor (ECF subfamily)
MTDAALLAGLAAGEPEVALAFVRRFQRRVFGVALAVVGDPALAEDVAQQAFEKAWRRGSLFDPSRGSVGSWLTAITHNLGVDALRSRKPTPIDPADLIRLMGPGFDEPEDLSVGSEAAADLRRAIRRLPNEQARAVVMAGIYGLTARDIANAESIPLGTAKTRIRAGIGRLRTILAPAGHPSPGPLWSGAQPCIG